jgi:hypothetical protein
VTTKGATEDTETAGTEAHPETAGYRRKIRITHAVVATLATIGGAVMGFIVTLAIVVARARYGHYIFAMEDLMAFRWELLPIPIGAAAGWRLAYKRPHAVAWATVAAFVSMLLGIVAGALLGPLIWGDNAGHWAGGVIFGAIGLVAGAVGSLRIRHVPRNHFVAGGAATLVFLGVVTFAIFGATNLLDIDPLEFPEAAGVPVPDPAKVDAVVFLVGDAGAALTGRYPLLSALRTDVERWSSALHRDSAVSVAFLGDNVYPVGIRPRSDPGFPADSARLWSQFDLVSDTAARRYKSLGLFVTGNHDWGNSASDIGFDRVISMSDQVRAARGQGTFVALLPAAGDPGPVYRDLRRNVRIAFMDTHWFLRERHPAQRASFFERLKKTLDGARDREVILIAHHPYRSAGPHGAIVPGYHTLGIAYVMKKAGALVQDLNSPPYDDLRAGLRATFDGSRKPPLIYAGGHDHSLQVLSGEQEFDPRFVLVSGAGSKASSVQMGTGLAWAADQPGYMMLVFRKDDGVDLFVIGGDKTKISCAGTDEEIRSCMADGVNAFTIVYSASLLGPSKAPRDLAVPLPDSLQPGTPWWTDAPTAPPAAVVDSAPRPAAEPAPVAVPTRLLLAGIDSVTTTPGRTYSAGRIRRLFAGDLNRHLWRVPVKLPVLDLGELGGGLTPEKIIGGKQTVGLRLKGRNGLEYDFRPVVKNPAAVLPAWLREGLVRDELEDQMAAQFPFGATLVAELLESAGIVAPRPVAAVMPNDARLGEFRSMFAGRVGLFSINPEERSGNRPGFGGYAEIYSSDSMYARTKADPASTFDDRHFLKIRLIDALVGDWDRHSGQWRWGVERKRSETVWRAIPEDRDWAFASVDGPVALVARLVLPSYVGFSENLPGPRRLAVSGDRIDHRVLNRLTEEDFVEVARDVRAVLSDSVIDASIKALPPEYLPLERDHLVKSLRNRRDQLMDYAAKYYRFLAKSIHVYGFDGSADVIEFQRVSDERARVLVRQGGPEGPVRFERLIDGRETGEVKLYIDEGTDRIVGGEDLPFRVTIAQDQKDGGETRRP